MKNNVIYHIFTKSISQHNSIPPVHLHSTSALFLSFKFFLFHLLTCCSFVTYDPLLWLCILQPWSFTTFYFLLILWFFFITPILFILHTSLFCPFPLHVIFLSMWFSSFLVPSSFSLWYFTSDLSTPISVFMTTLYTVTQTTVSMFGQFDL